MGVDVDPAGCDELAGGVDDPGRVTGLLAGVGVDHRGDHPVVHHDVGEATGRTGSIDDESPTDHEIMHATTLVPCGG